MSGTTASDRYTIIDYFTQLGRRHGASPAGVGWSPESQLKRFDAIAKLIDLDGARLLDAGCGYGALLEYLLKREIQFTYTGIDLTPLQIEMAVSRHPGYAESFRVTSLTDLSDGESYDYVIANGLLNIPTESPMAAMNELIEAAFAKSRVACVVTMRSTRATTTGPHLQPYDPRHVLESGLRLSSLVTLDHGYLPHDFAIVCRH